ncbi:hypothetical protein D3C77_791150 [compost metagenome]
MCCDFATVKRLALAGGVYISISKSGTGFQCGHHVRGFGKLLIGQIGAIRAVIGDRLEFLT